MFANMDFPEDPAWVSGVADEVRQQLARWQGRPCLAVVCGNSEVSQQAAMFGATRDKWSPGLFAETLAALVQAQLPALPYWPSSAFGGVFPHQNDEGTTSYYGVGAYMRDLGDARRSGVRFATECLAFANIPEDDGLADMPDGLSLRMHHPGWKRRVPRDLGAGWDFDDVRDHYVAQLFKVDPAQLRYADHDRYLLLGRLAVHEAMQSTLGEWRLRASRCRGALVWFWRDLWPGAGWGVVDSSGRPKSAFHALRKVCQPHFLHLTEESGNGYVVHLHNDTAEAVEGSVEVAVWRDAQTRLALETRPFTVASGQGVRTPLLAWFDWFADWSHFYRFGPCPAQAIVAVWRAANGRELGRAHAFPPGFALPLVAAGLEATATAQPDGSVTVDVVSNSLLQFVHADAPGWVASEAYVHLSPGQAWRLCMRPGPGAVKRPFSGALKALNLQGPVPIRMVAA
jgi:beta-mannosidase